MLEYIKEAFPALDMDKLHVLEEFELWLFYYENNNGRVDQLCVMQSESSELRYKPNPTTENDLNDDGQVSHWSTGSPGIDETWAQFSEEQTGSYPNRLIWYN